MGTQSDWFSGFLVRLAEGGWLPIFACHGWPVSYETCLDPLGVDRSVEGFEEFSLKGERAIEPGDPSLSLLYHALMHPGIVAESITFWPALEDIDSLENYIYAQKYSALESAQVHTMLSGLTPVVMAYEYRVSQRTPHQVHADLVFSRTGVGRVGTHAPEYSPQRRCFNTTPNDSSGGTRVQPARYGVFLCREALGGNTAIQGKAHSGDECRVFYVPVLKLFDGMLLGGEAIQLNFSHYHQSDKLQRMISRGKLPLDGEFDLQQAPFYYRSDRDDIAATSEYAGGVTVWRNPQEMCRMAKQGDSIVTFVVPKEHSRRLNQWLGKINLSYNNRRYTTLRVGQSIWMAGLDLALNFLLSLFKSDKRVFLSPRESGEFTNIRHVLNQEGLIEDLNLLKPGCFKAKLSQGGYSAILYEDPIAEGFVKAEIVGFKPQMVQAKPAYSLMTAPDFMPRVGNIDIYQHEKLFAVGGPRALCEGRLAVNLRLSDPVTGEPIFSPSEQTVTAITVAAREGERLGPSKEYNNTHYMTDEASDIFAPGWDVTYSRESYFSPPYYHTSGLGSPFLEDVKLCAAANGMWPAASPDAARTFRRTKGTALTLTDEELGIYPTSALGLRQDPAVSAAAGWDGEYGPFITRDNNQWVVNYASIERSDYVTNYQADKVDFTKLRNIGRYEADRRLSAYGDIKAILECWNTGHSWLVSFVVVPPLTSLRDCINLPEVLWGINPELHELKTPTGCYLYLFAKYAKRNKGTDELKRRIQPIDELLCIIATHNDEDNSVIPLRLN